MQLYLIRHGQSFVNLPDQNDYSKDWALTDLGHQQAAALGRFLPSALASPDIIYASTMKRARQTAEYVSEAYNLPVNHNDSIREIGSSSFDHRPYEDGSIPQFGEHWVSERPFSNISPSAENSESMLHFRARVGAFLQHLMDTHVDETVLVVCHGFVVDTFFDLIFNIGPYRHCEVWTTNTGIAHFEYIRHPNREAWRLHRMNWQEHLASINS